MANSTYLNGFTSRDGPAVGPIPGRRRGRRASTMVIPTSGNEPAADSTRDSIEGTGSLGTDCDRDGHGAVTSGGRRRGGRGGGRGLSRVPSRYQSVAPTSRTPELLLVLLSES